MEIVEQLGSGVPGILKVYGRDAFIISENFIRVVLPYADGFNESSNAVKVSAKEAERMILDLLSENPSITIDFMAGSTGVSRRRVVNIISDLKSAWILKRGGSDKSGYWDVSDMKK